MGLSTGVFTRRKVGDPVEDERALDAALLAFGQEPDSSPLRAKIQSAISAYASAIRRCPTCGGSGEIQVIRGRVYEDENWRPSSQPVASGAKISCVTCDGEKVDPGRMGWMCVAGHGCAPNRPRDSGHELCGWALRADQVFG